MLLSLSYCFLVVFVMYLQELKIYLINLGYDPRSNILSLKIFRVAYFKDHRLSCHSVRVVQNSEYNQNSQGSYLRIQVRILNL